VRSKMKTAGDLRDFLLEMMEGVRNGSADLQRASVVAKLAAQVTASLTAEAQMALVSQRLGKEFGAAMLGPPDVETSAEERTNVAVAQIGPRRSGDPVWCEQCEQRVHPDVADKCKSAFCKARAA
jgi:hypothetical protein